MRRLRPFPTAARLLLASVLFGSPALAGGPGQRGEPPAPQASAQERPVVQAADVLALVERVRLETEQLRQALGRPAALGAPPRPQGAGLRECAHHAQFLYRRAERLALELRRLRAPAPPGPPGRVDHATLWTYLDATLDRLADARAALGLPAIAPSTPVAGLVDDDRLLAALIQAERSVAALAPAPASYRELHLCVTRALAYASCLRASFPGRRMPPSPAADPSSSHADVWLALEGCLERARVLALRAQLPPLVHRPERLIDAPGTNELLALAELVEMELASLYRRHGNPDLLPPICDPGVQSCASLQQRCTLLALQLAELQRSLERNPQAWRPGGVRRLSE